MLPKFTKLQEEINEYYMKVFEKARVGYLDPFSKVNVHPLFEGNSSGFINENGEYIKTELKEIKETISVRDDEIDDMDINKIAQRFGEMGKSFANQQIVITLDSISEAVQKIGNVVNMKGEKLKYEHILEMLEKIQIDFDEYDKPILPIFVTGNKAFDIFKNLFEQCKDDKIFESKQNELFEKKLLEYRARESNRTLVD